MSDIEYINELRSDPLVLDKYIYVVVSEGPLSYLVHDSFFEEEDALIFRKNKEAEELKYNLPFRKTYSIHKSRLYK